GSILSNGLKYPSKRDSFWLATYQGANDEASVWVAFARSLMEGVVEGCLQSVRRIVDIPLQSLIEVLPRQLMTFGQGTLDAGRHTYVQAQLMTHRREPTRVSDDASFQIHWDPDVENSLTLFDNRVELIALHQRHMNLSHPGNHFWFPGDDLSRRIDGAKCYD